MNFSKKQKVIIWVTVLLALFFLGLKGRSVVTIPPDMEGNKYYKSLISSMPDYDIKLYGITITKHEAESKTNIPFNFFCGLGTKNYLVTVAIIIIGIAAVITSKKK